MGLVRRGVTSRLTFQFGRFNRVGQANCYLLGGWSEGEWLAGSGAIVQGISPFPPMDPIPAV